MCVNLLQKQTVIQPTSLLILQAFQVQDKQVKQYLETTEMGISGSNLLQSTNIKLQEFSL